LRSARRFRPSGAVGGGCFLGRGADLESVWMQSCCGRGCRGPSTARGCASLTPLRSGGQSPGRRLSGRWSSIRRGGHHGEIGHHVAVAEEGAEGAHGVGGAAAAPDDFLVGGLGVHVPFPGARWYCGFCAGVICWFGLAPRSVREDLCRPLRLRSGQALRDLFHLPALPSAEAVAGFVRPSGAEFSYESGFWGNLVKTLWRRVFG
jgi:hypothetical protein